MTIYERKLEVFVLIADGQTHHLNTHVDISSRARGQNFGLSLHLHTNFVYASDELFGESAKSYVH